MTPDQLGLKDVTSTADARCLPPAEDESLVGMLDNAAQLLDQLGAAGTALAPHLLHAWKDTVTTRRAMLGLLDPPPPTRSATPAPPPHHSPTWSSSPTRYQALYPSADPKALLTSVAAHVRMATDALRHDPSPDERRRLLRNLAQVAILAGRLASEDLGNTMSGRTYYSLALDTAREAGDGQLAAIAHGYAAQLAAAEGLTIAALDHLTAATEHARSHPGHHLLARRHRGHHPRRPGRPPARTRCTRPRPHRTRQASQRPAPAWLDEHSRRPPGRRDGTHTPPSRGPQRRPRHPRHGTRQAPRDRTPATRTATR